MLALRIWKDPTTSDECLGIQGEVVKDGRFGMDPPCFDQTNDVSIFELMFSSCFSSTIQAPVCHGHHLCVDAFTFSVEKHVSSYQDGI